MTDMLGLAMLHEETTRRAERPRDDQWYYEEFGPPIGRPGVFRRVLAAVLRWVRLRGAEKAPGVTRAGQNGDTSTGFPLPTVPAACPRRYRPASLRNRKQAA
jgi:hypothetical protein